MIYFLSQRPPYSHHAMSSAPILVLPEKRPCHDNFFFHVIFFCYFSFFEIFSKKLACRTTRARPFVLDCWILEIPGPDDVHRDLFVSGPIARRAIQARHSISVDLQK
jgi:hypothetical protein